MDAAPNCAICNAPAYPECPCESERLQIAVKQAEARAMDSRLAEIRDWVISHARKHILNAFERLTSTRKQAHAAYLASLPNYSIYMQYSGHPPLHPFLLGQLQAQISEAHAELKRGIDADWRASVVRYPEVLDYFYSLVEVRLPSDRAQGVSQPPFAVSGYVDKGYELSTTTKEKKKSRRDRDASSPPERDRRSRREPTKEDHSYTVVGRTRVPPMVPTPPIQPGNMRR
ncbi:hypothetical protein BU16DRAFT_528731 [Lophium mytilinum]|uniref:Uncharacterized protein n=1 Tax=Lophium mytilinum TaxID=390894 RepID=A0A6A6QLR1_9PEZI|nr:hypothetical protein BU16DRAFT_528731 [Lophium mytilinum]